MEVYKPLMLVRIILILLWHDEYKPTVKGESASARVLYSAYAYTLSLSCSVNRGEKKLVQQISLTVYILFIFF